MSTLKYKHLSFEDRCIIQEFLNLGYNFSSITNRLHKDRRTISKEVFRNRFLRSKVSNNSVYCPHTLKPPYVCNDCPNINACSKVRYSYDAAVAHNIINLILKILEVPYISLKTKLHLLMMLPLL